MNTFLAQFGFGLMGIAAVGIILKHVLKFAFRV
jgi:hypothetical protein